MTPKMLDFQEINSCLMKPRELLSDRLTDGKASHPEPATQLPVPGAGISFGFGMVVSKVLCHGCCLILFLLLTHFVKYHY